jgi:nucleotide-binding universal stress UspA family protein
MASVPSQLATYQRLEHLHFSERDLLEAVASEILDTAEMRARGHGVRRVTTSIGYGHAAGTIIAYATKHLAEDDVIVMGRRGLGDVSGLILGSVSHEVSHLADCGVLTVR